MDYGVVYSGFKIVERNSGESADILEGYSEDIHKRILNWDLRRRISRISEILATYYIGGTQISTNLNKEIRGKMRILNKYYMELKRFLSIISNHLNRIEILHMINLIICRL